MSRVSTELEISRNTVRSVLKSQWGQERLNEAYQNIDHALISLPELVAISLTKLKTLINQDEATRFRNIEAKKFELEAVKVALNLATKVREMQSNVLINSVATLD